MAADLDLVIRNGLIIDGSGDAPFQADVAVKDGRIAAVDGGGKEEIDAKDRLVTPGNYQLELHAPEIKYDLPAGGLRLDQGAAGYVATIVSGAVIRRGDQAKGALPGKLVRGSQAAPV